MTASNPLVKAKREYLTACIAAVFTAIVGLGMPDRYGQHLLEPKVLIFIIAIAVLIAVRIRHTLRPSKPSTGQGVDDSVAPSISRLRRMVFIWYALTLVLAAPVGYKLVTRLASKSLSGISTIEWMLGLASAIMAGFAAWKLFFVFFGQKRT